MRDYLPEEDITQREISEFVRGGSIKCEFRLPNEANEPDLASLGIIKGTHVKNAGCDWDDHTYVVTNPDGERFSNVVLVEVEAIKGSGIEYASIPYTGIEVIDTPSLTNA